MKHKKTVHRRFSEEVIEFITCDICKKKYKGRNWERENYSALETEIKLTTGFAYPEGGSGEETIFDICPTCFIDKLIPMLKELEAEPTVIEWDW